MKQINVYTAKELFPNIDANTQKNMLAELSMLYMTTSYVHNQDDFDDTITALANLLNLNQAFIVFNIEAPNHARFKWQRADDIQTAIQNNEDPWFALLDYEYNEDNRQDETILNEIDETKIQLEKTLRRIHQNEYALTGLWTDDFINKALADFVTPNNEIDVMGFIQNGITNSIIAFCDNELENAYSEDELLNNVAGSEDHLFTQNGTYLGYAYAENLK